jgi:hypothetical protein
VSTYIDNESVVLIDTPGFDDSDRTDADILSLIAEWLKQSYDQSVRLTGIILLQPINVNRAQGSERVRTRLFRDICGDNAFDHVVIATTMWDEVTDRSQGLARVSQRIGSDDFWGKMVNQGAMVMNHENNKESAHHIIRQLLYKGEVVVQMQTELERSDGQLQSTTAAQHLYEHLGTASADERRKMSELLEALRLERKYRTELQEEIQEMRRVIQAMDQQMEVIRNSRVSTVSTFIYLFDSPERR